MSLQRNASKIAAAFGRLSASKDAIIAEGFARMMQAGLDALLEAHDTPIIGEDIFAHNEMERETLGWMIFHDGREVASGTQDRGEITGAILYRLEALGSRTTGWVGYLMSDMSFDWYRVDYEKEFLFYSRDEIRRDFSRYFKPVSATS